MLLVMRFLHIFPAFAWSAAVFAAHWNTLQARRTGDWSRRATLFGLNRGLSAMVALPALLGLEIVGNLLAMELPAMGALGAGDLALAHRAPRPAPVVPRAAGADRGAVGAVL